MSENITRFGGSPIPTEVFVTVDGGSIGGDGSAAHPLHTVPGGTIIATDATLTGDGTIESPLHVVGGGGGGGAVLPQTIPAIEATPIGAATLVNHPNGTVDVQSDPVSFYIPIRLPIGAPISAFTVTKTLANTNITLNLQRTSPSGISQSLGTQSGTVSGFGTISVAPPPFTAIQPGFSYAATITVSAGGSPWTFISGQVS